MSRELVLQLEMTIENFWKSTRLTHHDFERDIFDRNASAYNYQHWQKLIGLAESLLEFDRITADMVELVYMVMALDNRKKEVMSFIVNNVEEGQFEIIVKYALYSPYPDTRAQIAEALGMKVCSFSKHYLEKYLIDDHPYVVSKALEALCKVDEKGAEQKARNFLFDESEVLRQTADYVLKNIES